MKILYILKRELCMTGMKMLVRLSSNPANQVTVVRVQERSAEELLDLIESHDKLIMW